MFLYSSAALIESDTHRLALLADAEHHRLVTLAKAARRAARHRVPPVDPPRGPDRPEADPPQRNNEANRRYAVSR